MLIRLEEARSRSLTGEERQPDSLNFLFWPDRKFDEDYFLNGLRSQSLTKLENFDPIVISSSSSLPWSMMRSKSSMSRSGCFFTRFK